MKAILVVEIPDNVGHQLERGQCVVNGRFSTIHAHVTDFKQVEDAVAGVGATIEFIRDEGLGLESLADQLEDARQVLNLLTND